LTDDWEDTSLTPWERETVAWMEDELDLRDPAAPHPAGRRPADRLGPMFLVGGAITLFGAVVAFTAGAPLGLAGWILLLVGLVVVWDEL
jgi:hypothetical protein